MVRYQNATRAQVVGLLAAGLPSHVVEEQTGIRTMTQYRWWDKAVARGFDPKKRPVIILDKYVEDGKRTGRRPKTQEEREREQNKCGNENDNENEDHEGRQPDATGAAPSDPPSLPYIYIPLMRAP